MVELKSEVKVLTLPIGSLDCIYSSQLPTIVLLTLIKCLKERNSILQNWNLHSLSRFIVKKKLNAKSSLI
jgi:hypothetical protein